MVPKAIKCKAYSEITVESGHNGKTVHICSVGSESMISGTISRKEAFPSMVNMLKNLPDSLVG